MNIIKNYLLDNQYYQQKSKKTQIVLHHTASGPNVQNIINGWNLSPNKIGTAYIIGNDGKIYECFDPSHWAAHVGYYIQGVGGNDIAYKLLPQTANKATNLNIEMRTIGIEMVNWGNLTFKNGKYYNYVGGIVPENEVETLNKPFRGSIHYHKYTTPQIQSMIELVKELGDKFKIPLKFSQNFEFDTNAVLGKSGLFLHTNYRFDKSDLHHTSLPIAALKQFT